MSNRPPFELGFTLATSRLPCPYSYQRAQGAVRGSSDSDAAMIGTLHHVNAKQYNEGLIARRQRPGQSGRTHDVGMLRNIQRKVFDASGINPESDLARYYWKLGQQFESYRLTQGEGRWIVEERLAVDREWKVCEVSAPVDKLAGTPDLGRIDEGGLSGLLRDEKFGNRHVSYDSASQSIQLKTYSFLFFCHHPTLRKIQATIACWTLHGCTESTTQFHRDSLMAEMKSFYNAKWGLVDLGWNLYGNDDWPTYGSAECCGYCRLKCPKLNAICGGQFDA